MLSHDTTRKMTSVTPGDEKNYYRRKYNEAKVAYILNSTEENRHALAEANTKLFETLNAYELGARLLAERARILANALFGRESFF